MTSRSGLFCLRGVVLVCGVMALAMLMALPARAQRFQYFYGGPNCVEAGRGGVTPSVNGGYIAVGESFSPGNCGPSDIYVVRTDNLGAHKWEYTYDIGGADSATSVIECANGDIVVVGVSATAFPSPCGPTRDAFLMRLDPCGGVIWLNTYGSTATDEIGWDVVEAQSGDPAFNTSVGDLIVAGSTALLGTPRDGYMFRVTPTGGLIWDCRYDIGFNRRDDYFYSLDEAIVGPPPPGTSTHDIVAAGGTNYIGTYDALIVRVDGNTGRIGAAPQGAATYGTTTGDEDLRSIQELSIGTEAGNLVATGRTSSFLANADVYLLKTAANPCTFLGDRRLGDAGTLPDEGYCIREITVAGQPGMPVGDLVVTGYLTTTAALGGFGGKDVFLQEFTPGLAPVAPLTTIYGGTGTDWGWSVAVLPSQSGCRTAGYIICGFSTSRLDPLHPNDPQQLYLIKTDVGKSSLCNSKTITTNTSVPGLPGMCPRTDTAILTRVCPSPTTRICHVWDNRLCLALDGIGFCPGIACPDCVPTKEHLDEPGNTTIELDGAGALSTLPNPVRSGERVILEYRLAHDAIASVTISDLAGRVVYVHHEEERGGGVSISVSTAGWSIGTYLIRLEVEGRTTTRRLVVGER